MFYLFIKRSGLSRYRRRGTVRRAERIQRERDDGPEPIQLAFLPSAELPNATLALAPWAAHSAAQPPQGE